MKKLFFFLFVLTQFTSLSAQQCNAGGCGFGGSQYPGGTFSNPGAAFVTVSTLIYGGEYQLYNVTSGNYYEWTYCSADGANGVEDMQLTLFNNANGTQLCYSDDICDGNRPKIGWTANFTGTVRVLTSLYYCTTNTTSHTLRWREVCVGPAFPGFGSNSWNVAVWNAGDAAGNSGAWSSNYAGYYNIPSLSFDTRQGVTYSTAQSWDPNGTPSSASGYVGCPVGADNHSYAFRRQGFPCAIYQINIPTHDDESHLYINGVLVWEHDNGCCDAHTNVWTGVLGPNTQIDYYVSEGGGGSHGSLEILNVGALAINSSNASMYTCDAARALTVNNSNPAGGVWSGTGVSGASFNPASAGVGGPHTITYSNQGCSATQGISVVSNGNPATFGANTWNVYGYNGNDVNLGGGVSYRGFYTEPLLSYQSINRWCNTCAPSDASGWAGCAVGIDNHTVVSKRTGVPSNGVYSVSVNLHDDNFQLYTGGVNKFESGYCCMVHTDVLTEYMDGATSMELRHGEGVGGSGQGLLFTQQNLSATISKTDKTACTTNNGTITFSNPTGAVAAPVFRSNFSAATGVTVSGSASVTGGILQLTPNAGSQLGGAIFTNSTATNASSFRAEFDFRVFDGSEADGFSFNYGNMAGPPANAGEGGWGTGLCVNFVTYPGAGGPFVRVLYGGANISGNIGVAIRNAAYRKCVIFVNASNQLSVSINGVAVITNLGLPAGFASTDKTAWQFSMSGRTGGATDNHWIDNLVINAYNQYEYSLDGTSWTSNPAFTGLATGTYTPRLRNKAFPTYPVSLANVTIANPSSPTATVGVTNVTCNGGSNGVVSANATGAAAPYSYAWSGGGTSAIKTNCAPGTYTVTVTSSTSCSATASSTVTQPAAIGLSTSITNASCLGVCDGAVNLSVSGGTPSTKQPNAVDLSSSLVLWANGDNGVLRDAAAGTQQWSDLSGLGNNITQASASNRPSFVTNVINGRPVLRFNTSQFMTTAASFSQPYTIFTITKMNNGSDQRLISSADVNWLMGNWGGNQNVMHNNNWLLAPPGPTPDNLPHMYAVTSVGATTNFYDFSTLLASGAGGSSAIGRLQLNGWLNGLNEMSDADVAEVIIYNRVLTASELQGVRNYLAAKYAVAGSGGSAYTYNWSNGATTEDVNTLCAGTFTVTVTDGNGCTASASPVVGTTVDNTAPIITCPANISVNATAGTCGAVVTYTAPVGSDNCPGATTVRTAGLASGSTFPVGTTIITHQVTASNGATASCSFTVTVVDNQAPTITCPANISVNATAGTCGAVVTYTAPVGSDNCPGATTVRTAGSASGSTFPVGTTIVTHQVNAANGQTANCSFSVTVTDNQAPTITCPANITVNATAGQCAAVVTYTAPVGTDNCPGATTTRTAGFASGSSFPVGVTTVTHQVTAANGQTASCSFTVTVVDNQAPTITCPANISVNATVGQCAAVVTYTTPVGSDNCPGATTTRTAGFASGSSFPVGVTTVTHQVTAANGQTASCSFTVTVVDNQAPTITCPANISVNATVGQCAAVVTYTTPVGSDNCPGATTTRTAGFASGSSFPVGVTTVTHQVTASNGVTASCSFTVTVVDNQVPIITCPANITVNATVGQCAAVVTYTTPVGSDNCPGATTIRTAGPASGSSFPVGVTTVTHQVTAANGQTASCSFTVTVVDNQAPTITCPANISMNATAGTCGAVVTYTTPVGSDNCPGAVTTRTAGLASGSTFPVGTTIVTHQVNAANGQTANCSFSVTVTDNQAPTITCPANITVNATAGQCAAVVTYTAPVGTDNCPGATTTRTAGFASGSSFPVGVTTVTHQVTAANGATASCSFTVTVVDNQAPTITCPANISVNATAGTCGAVVTYTAPVGSDNCPGATTTLTAGLASGSSFPVGVTTVTHTVTAANGATASCSFTVTVVDNIIPVLVDCPANIVRCISNAVVTFISPTATDNCPGVTVLQIAGLPSGSTFPDGITTNTFQAQDAAGNLATCSFTVTVDALPTTPNAGADVRVCGDAITLSAANPSPSSGAWTTITGTGTFSSTSVANPSVTGLTYGTNTFRWKTINGQCELTDDVTIIGNRIPTDIPHAVGTYTATRECIDISTGWTHYFDNNGGDNTNNNRRLISLKKNGNNIGTMGDGTFDGRVVIENGYNSDGYLITSNIAPYVVNNVNAWAVMARYWDVTPTQQPSSNVDVAFYYDNTDYQDVLDRAAAQLWEPIQTPHVDLQFFKVVGSNSPAPSTGHPGYTSSDVVIYDKVTTPTWTYAPFNSDHSASYSVSSFSGGGGGFGGGGQGALPVELISFTATPINNEYIRLDWATALEINNDGFELQRSTDAQNWTNIAWINGNDNSTNTQFYNHNDMQVAQNITYYYRLKQIDNDGQFEYSNIVNATLTGSNSSFNVLEFVPNPTVDQTTLLISSGAAQTINVSFYNAIGQVVQSNTHELSEGMNKITFDVNTLAAGTYMATVTSGNEVRTKRLIIAK